jgi:hypothetical protein
MQPTFQKLFYTSLILASTLIATTKIAVAQMMIYPMVIESDTQKGQAKGSFSITNNSPTLMRTRVRAQSFSYGRKGFEIVKENAEDLVPYLVFSPREFVLQPGQTRQVRLSAQLLPSMKDREFRAIIFTDNLTAIDNAGNTNAGTSQASIIPSLGLTFYVRQGKTDSQLTVLSASAVSESPVKLLVKNSGNATVRPEILWKLVDKNGIEVSGKFDPITIIAGGDREIPLIDKLGPSFSPGTYELKGEFRWQKGKDNKSQSFTIPLAISANSNTKPAAIPTAKILK